MKRHLLVLSVAIIVAAMFSYSASAAPIEKKVILLSTEYQSGGIVMIFETSGLTNADLKNASVYANSHWHKMYCKFVDKTEIVRCSFTKKLAGQGSFVASLGGFAFWGTLPDAKEDVVAPAPLCPSGQLEVYHLDATCTHSIQVSYNFTVPPGGDLATFLQQILDMWAFFGDPLTVNSVTFVGCQP